MVENRGACIDVIDYMLYAEMCKKAFNLITKPYRTQMGNSLLGCLNISHSPLFNGPPFKASLPTYDLMD